MPNTRTFVHTENTIVKKSGDEIVMFAKNTLQDVATDERSKITAVGKIVFSAICNTAAGIAKKTTTVPGYALVEGSHLTVQFINGITVANPTLNVNNTGAKPIMLNGASLPTGVILANNQIILKYNGTSFDVVCGAGPTHVSKDNTKKLYFVGVDDSNLNGTAAKEYFNSSVYVNAAGDTLVSPKFSGDGSNITNMNATQIKSGTLNAARLPASGVIASGYGSSETAILGFGNTFTIPHITVDKYGRITSASNVELTLPNPDTDVKVSSVANNSAGFYLSGTTNPATSTGTLVHNTGVYVAGSRLYSASMQASTMYFDSAAQYITGSSYTGQAATVGSISAHLEDGLASTATNKAATANAARKLSVGISSLIGQLGTQATFSLSGSTLTITTKAAPSVTLA